MSTPTAGGATASAAAGDGVAAAIDGGGGARVALVHDYLLVSRGAERTFAAIAACWPEAPIFTLLYDREGTRREFAGRSVHASYLQRLGVGQRNFRRLLPLFPAAVQSLPLDEYDLVISSSSAFAHGVRLGPDATHLCYCHSPFRYAWHERSRALAEAPSSVRPMLGRLLERIRDWDRAAAQGVTRYVANSLLTRERIRKFYGRHASVVHPPVEVERFAPGTPEDYFLVVCELVAHKRVELALEAARRARRPIKVVGDGPQRAELMEAYRSTAEFLGRVDDRELAQLYARACALVVPNIEEFGIAAVEAQAAGRPVIAADGGGARETVVEDVSGVFFAPGDVDALAQAMRSIDLDRFVSRRIREHAARFSPAAFKRTFAAETRRLALAPMVRTPARTGRFSSPPAVAGGRADRRRAAVA